MMNKFVMIGVFTVVLSTSVFAQGTGNLFGHNHGCLTPYVNGLVYNKINAINEPSSVVVDPESIENSEDGVYINQNDQYTNKEGSIIIDRFFAIEKNNNMKFHGHVLLTCGSAKDACCSTSMFNKICEFKDIGAGDTVQCEKGYELRITVGNDGDGDYHIQLTNKENVQTEVVIPSNR